MDATWQFYGQPTRFVGRVRELHRLRECFRNAVDAKKTRAILVMGPAGIGKSRLLAEFNDTVEQHVSSATVLSVACRPDGGPPYSLFRRLLLGRFYVAPDASAEKARQQVQAGLSQILRDEAVGEEAAHFIGHLVGLPYPDSAHIAKVDSEPRRVEERALELLRRFLEADAARSPITATVDNLHLASEESISLLSKLAGELSGAPILFIGLARPFIGERHAPFTQGFKGRAVPIELSGLADRDSRRIVADLLGRLEQRAPEAFVKLTCEKAMGNPLSLQQIIQLQIERGAIDTTQTPWQIQAERLDDTRIPRTLRDVVRTKLTRLAKGERAILEKAAAVGDLFWTEVVDALRRSDEGDGWDERDRYWNTERKTDELAAILTELKRKEILLRSPQSPFPRSREYVFKHTLERELLYEGIEGPRRARYHRLIAQWLERQDPERVEDLIEQIALHWERGHQLRRAATYYVQAGDRALGRYLNEKAASSYSKALECLTDDDATERVDVFHKLGKVYMTLGDHAEALGFFQMMLRVAWQLDDRRRGGLAYNKMGQSYRALGEYKQAEDHFKNGLALFRREEDVVGIAMSADDIGKVHWLRGDIKQALELYTEGLRLRRVLGGDRRIAVSLYHIGQLHTELGDFKTAIGSLRDALELARASNDRKTIADVLNTMAVICHHRGDFEKSLKLWDEALQMARELGEKQLQGVLLNNSGEAALSLGDPERARELLQQAIAIIEAVGDRRSLSDALRNLGDACLRLNRYDEALEYSQLALQVAEELGARAYLGLAARNLGEVYARTLYDDEAERDARVIAAECHFVSSIEELRAVGLEAELGKSLLAHGAFLVEVGREEDARAELERARSLFERLEMREHLERVGRMLTALG